MTPVTIKKQDGIAVLSLSAPNRRNALTPSMAEQMVAYLDDVDADSSIGALVLVGGARGFCSGMDIDALNEVQLEPLSEESFEAISVIYRCFGRLTTLAVPTIAAVRGVAVGAGVNLAFAADLRVVAHDSRFVSGFGPLGLHPGGGHFLLAAEAVGREFAVGFGVLGLEVSGAELANRGGAFIACEDQSVEPTALEIAARAAKDPSLTRAMMASVRATVAGGTASWPVAADVERVAQLRSYGRGRSDGTPHRQR